MDGKADDCVEEGLYVSWETERNSKKRWTHPSLTAIPLMRATLQRHTPLTEEPPTRSSPHHHVEVNTLPSLEFKYLYKFKVWKDSFWGS